VKETISKNIRFIRQGKGLSQKRLAELSRIDVRQISKMENHPAHLSTATLEKLANGLGVSIIELLKSQIKAKDMEIPKEMELGLQEAVRVLKTYLERIKK